MFQLCFGKGKCDSTKESKVKKKLEINADEQNNIKE